MTTATRSAVMPLTPSEERHLARLLERLGFTVEDQPVVCYRALLELDRWLPDTRQQRGALGGRS